MIFDGSVVKVESPRKSLNVQLKLPLEKHPIIQISWFWRGNDILITCHLDLE